MASLTVENYVKTVYQICASQEGRPAATGQLATSLGVLPGTVTSMLKTLNQSRLVTYQTGVRHGIEKEWAGSHSVRYLRIEIPWQNGKVHGQRKLYHPNGKVMTTTTYRNDVVTDESRTLDPEGRLERTVSFRNGKKHGEMKDLWPETGKLRRSITYRDGKVEGVAREYYSNGKLKRESPLKNNALHGIEKLFQPDGKPQETRYWIDGDLVDEKEFKERFTK